MDKKIDININLPNLKKLTYPNIDEVDAYITDEVGFEAFMITIIKKNEAIYLNSLFI